MRSTKHVRALLGFARMADEQLLSRGQAVIAGITGNSAFPDPPVAPAVLGAELNKYAALITESLDGSRKAIVAKRKQRETVSKMLRRLGHYVEAVSDDDPQVFLSSGFEAVSQTHVQSQPRFSGPRILKIDHGTGRGFRVKVSKEAGIRSYELSYVAAGDGTASSTTIGFTSVISAIPVTNLTPGTAYTLQVRGLGNQGYTGWSDPITRYCT